MEYVGKTDRPLDARMRQHRSYKDEKIESSAMVAHQRQEGCRGFMIEILEEVPEGEDILVHEDLWIRYFDPELHIIFYNLKRPS